MKIKQLSFFLLFLGLPFIMLAQTKNKGIQKGSRFINGMFSYSTKTSPGDLLFLKSERVSRFNLTTKYQKFIANGFAVGGALSITKNTIAPARNTIEDFKSDFFRLGQAASYFFDIGPNVAPYLGIELGASFAREFEDKGKGYYLNASSGLSIRKKHFAFLFELGILYDKIRFESSSHRKGTTIYSAIGIAGLLYPNQQQQ